MCIENELTRHIRMTEFQKFLRKIYDYNVKLFFITADGDSYNVYVSHGRNYI